MQNPDASTRGAARILYAEDTDEIRRMVKIALGGLGFCVDLARDGEEAWDCYQAAREDSCPYDFLLLDAAMPQLDGFSLADRIRTGGDNETPIGFFTAFDEPMAAMRAALVKAVGVWIKPTDLCEMTVEIARVLAATRDAQAPSAH